ncbi:ATP-dependent helicase, partial [Candidatus Pacearchaeota archaeon]|nr:ATP-dependent helicase [Candidatus Pacearchaeota archaeon]
QNGDLGDVPNGMHAVVPAQSDKGIMPGVIFTLRNRNEGVNVNQHNRLHPFYLVYINNSGEVITDHTEVKQLLDLVRNSCKGLDSPVHDICRLFNEETNDGREMKKYSDLLGQAIRSMIDVKEDKDIDSLFSGDKTTALVDTIAGLDDFELITFLVIKEVKL